MVRVLSCVVLCCVLRVLFLFVLLLHVLCVSVASVVSVSVSVSVSVLLVLVHCVADFRRMTLAERSTWRIDVRERRTCAYNDMEHDTQH